MVWRWRLGASRPALWYCILSSNGKADGFGLRILVMETGSERRTYLHVIPKGNKSRPPYEEIDSIAR